jgi:hypothetical protein
MRIRRAVRSLVPVAFATLGAIWIASGQQQARKVDDAALKGAAKTGEEWIGYNLGWSEQRFSALNQITAANVSSLGLARSSEIPSAQGRPQTRQEGTPLVYNGVMYSIAPGQVLDVTTGLSQMGPPMTFMLDGKQYVSVAGGPAAVPGGGGRGGPGGAPPGVVAPPAAGAPATPAPPSMMLTFVLDGKGELPKAPAAAAGPGR